MSPEDLEALLEITLGTKMAAEVMWETEGDACSAAEALKRRAAAMMAPYRNRHEAKGFASVHKDSRRVHLVARLLDELVYDFDEELDVELVRSA